MDSVPPQPGHPTDSVPKEHHLYKGAAALQYMPPDKKGSKGMNWEGAYHYVRPPDGRAQGVDQ